jgi:2-C-methyl-D-erythritol 4-phosphate cytidylyltransferase
MTRPAVAIFGAGGGIGSAVRRLFDPAEYKIVDVDRAIIDLKLPDADQEIHKFLSVLDPDIVINCAGVFVSGHLSDHQETMSVNVGSNWSIMRHYLYTGNQKKPVNLVMVGSSSYTGGRKQYPLYSASKAALYNLWQGVSESLAGTDIRVHLVNPVRTLTRMATGGKAADPALDYLLPEQVAQEIFKLATESVTSKCVDITFEDIK